MYTATVEVSTEGPQKGDNNISPDSGVPFFDTHERTLCFIREIFAHPCSLMFYEYLPGNKKSLDVK